MKLVANIRANEFSKNRLSRKSKLHSALGNAAGFFLIAGANLDKNFYSYRNSSSKIDIEVVNNEEYTVFRRFLAFVRRKYIISKGISLYILHFI